MAGNVLQITVPGDNPMMTANIQREMLELARMGSLAAGDMADGIFDDYQSNAGIDSGLSTNYTYDGTGKKVTPFEGSTGNSADEDITNIGIASGTVLVQDIKASITTWTKDASTTGHFDVANAAVTTGCRVTFADTSTATIVAKTGDGTGANNITLSVDHATDSGLVSITGLVYSVPNVTINTNATDAAQTWAATPNANANEATNARRQTHAAATLTTSGNQVRVTISAGNATATFTHICFAEVGTAPSAAGAFGGSQFKELLFGGSTGKTISSGQTAVSDWLDFAVDETKTYMTILAYAATSANAHYANSGSDGVWYKVAAAGDYATQTVSGYTEYAAWVFSVSKVEVRTVTTPAALFAINTNSAQLNTSLWSAMTAVTATQTLAGSSTAWHAASFNKGNAAEQWWVYLSSAWRSITALTSGTWQYRDAGGTLQNATINSRLGALAQALGISQNQMSATTLAAITSGQWATLFVAGTLDFACGLTADGNALPAVDKWTVTYNLAPQNMSLISTAMTGLTTPSKAMISLLVKGFDGSDTMKAYFSSATSPSWTELTGLTAVASNVGATGVSQFVSSQIPVTGSADKSIRTKVEMNAAQSLELHAQALIYG